MKNTIHEALQVIRNEAKNTNASPKAKAKAKGNEKDVEIMLGRVEHLSDVLSISNNANWSNNSSKTEMKKIMIDAMKKIHTMMNKVNKETTALVYIK